MPVYLSTQSYEPTSVFLTAMCVFVIVAVLAVKAQLHRGRR